MKKTIMTADSVDDPIKLKDGRLLFSTHNNFKRWLKDKEGKVLQVDENYYNNCKKSKV
tara:strand:- start:1334 stop:1507 length:174 start_codon:yes stop_codon:yes gene_type:complete